MYSLDTTIGVALGETHDPALAERLHFALTVREFGIVAHIRAQCMGEGIDLDKIDAILTFAGLGEHLGHGHVETRAPADPLTEIVDLLERVNRLLTEGR